jgi:hypothetical protein
MKKTKRQRQRQEKQSTRPQVISHRSWSKKTVRIFDKQFDQFLHDELYVPTKKAWGDWEKYLTVCEKIDDCKVSSSTQ